MVTIPLAVINKILKKEAQHTASLRVPRGTPVPPEPQARCLGYIVIGRGVTDLAPD
jgi:hypothetical protein